MCGGKLIQHIEGHTGNHRAQYAHGGEFEVTSTHHQQAVVDSVYFWDFLTADNGTVVEGWTSRRHSKIYAVQYHPEFMPKDSEGFKFYQDVIRCALGMATNKWEIKI
jgi:gamma-glutamyl-gamma-aminobutyrate hydrolase PuuD